MKIQFPPILPKNHHSNPDSPANQPKGPTDFTGVRIYTKEESLQRSQARLDALKRPGRPTLHWTKRSLTYGICLTASEHHEMRSYGRGSITRGARFLLEAARRGLIEKPTVEKPSRARHKIFPNRSRLTKIDPKTHKPYGPCDVCGEPQWRNAEVLTCVNGHEEDLPE